MACCLLASSGCANLPTSCIDPTGEHVFAPSCPGPAVTVQPCCNVPPGPVDGDALAVVLLQPREAVAPVGSEVVLIAGVGAADGFLRTNRRLEWTISQGSVGQFVAVEQNSFVDWLVGDFNRPRKVSNSFAVGSTSRENVRLSRGGCSGAADVCVSRGQEWITVTSPVEGSTYVTVLAPEVCNWNRRMKSAVIHWVDAQWRLPPPAINPAGTRRLLTTIVAHQTTQVPCEGWHVRYEVLSGPPAGFLPGGVRAVEITTNAAGQASAEIFQTQPAHGTNRVCIQVIRPGTLPGANGQRFVVGSGETSVTWAAPDLAIRVLGPARGNVGAVLGYRIEVGNPGELPAKDVVVTERLPEGLTYASSNPPAAALPQQLVWRLGELGSRQQRILEVNFRADRPGSVVNCCEATAAGGLKANGCATTPVAPAPVAPAPVGPAPAAGPTPAGPLVGPTPAGPSPLQIKITPESARASVGEKVTFNIVVANRGPRPALALVLKDHFDPGLDPGVPAAARTRSLSQPLGDLAPGASSRTIQITFRVTQPGRQCHTVEANGPSTPVASCQACVTASEATGGGAAPAGKGPAPVSPPAPVEQPPSQPRPPAAKQPPLSVSVIGPPETLAVGEMARFVIDVKNVGSAAVHKLKVLNRLDNVLMPKTESDMLATGGNQWEGHALTWQLDALPAGESAQFRILTKCQGPAGRACCRTKVTTGEGYQATGEGCCEIRGPEAPPPSRKPAVKASTATGLTMTVPGLHNPVSAGHGVTYRIQVTNNGPRTYRKVALTATFPHGFVPDPMGTQGPGGTQFRVALQAGKVFFNPIFELAPRQELVYEVRGLARQPVQGRFHVELSSPDLPKPLVQEVSAEAVK